MTGANLAPSQWSMILFLILSIKSTNDKQQVDTLVPAHSDAGCSRYQVESPFAYNPIYAFKNINTSLGASK